MEAGNPLFHRIKTGLVDNFNSGHLPKTIYRVNLTGIKDSSGEYSNHG